MDIVFALQLSCCSLSAVASFCLVSQINIIMENDILLYKIFSLIYLKRATKLYYRLAIAIGIYLYVSFCFFFRFLSSSNNISGIGLFLSSISGIVTAIYLKKHLKDHADDDESHILKVVVVGMRQLDFVVICYVTAMYASILYIYFTIKYFLTTSGFCSKKFGKARGKKKEKRNNFSHCILVHQCSNCCNTDSFITCKKSR